MIRIVVHGGAGNIADEYKSNYRVGVREATKTGFELLEEGKSALDAVEQAVMSMEDNPTFNAGRGSVITLDEKIEMDAMIMDGKSLRIGGVMGLENYLHPISISRAILENDRHIFYAGSGADTIAKKYGFNPLSLSELVTERTIQRFKKFKENPDNYSIFDPERREKYGTVGAVALDEKGFLASATSTGGILGKQPGRIGDTPIPGAGTYADDKIAVSATGIGEDIIRSMLGLRIANHHKLNQDIQASTAQSLKEMFSLVGGVAGVIVLNQNADISALHSTRDLAFAFNEGNQIKDFSQLTNSFIDVQKG